jgi:hypothetical protein
MQSSSASFLRSSDQKQQADTATSRCASPLDEAQSLIQRCAEPRPAGDNVEAAINRAAKRLGFTRGRSKALWCGEACRIDAWEMDRLRKCAVSIDMEQVLSGLKRIRDRLSATSSPRCRKLVDEIDAALNCRNQADLSNPTERR